MANSTSRYKKYKAKEDELFEMFERHLSSRIAQGLKLPFRKVLEEKARVFVNKASAEDIQTALNLANEVISLRKSHGAGYKGSEDPDVKKANDTHCYHIETLERVAKMLEEDIKRKLAAQNADWTGTPIASPGFQDIEFTQQFGLNVASSLM